MRKILLSSIAVLLSALASAGIITANPSNDTVCSAGSACFVVADTGNSDLRQWQVYDTTSASWMSLLDTGVYSGTATDSLAISAVNALNGVQYRCIISDATGSDTSAPAMIILDTPPSVSASITGVNGVCSGTTVQLTALASGPVTYQWSQNGTPISGATGSTYNAAVAGIYEVEAADASGCASLATTAPVLIYPSPQVGLSASNPALVICGSSSIILTATVAGDAATVQWLINGVVDSTVTSNTYVAASAGVYALTVTDSLGCTGMSQPDSVTAEPLPTPQIAVSGDTLDAGAGYTAYQWYLNGSPLAGATTEFYTPAPDGSQDGAYTVSVTSAGGCSGTSDAYTFTSTALGVENVSQNVSGFSVFPNPTTGIVRIRSAAPCLVTVQDAQGRVIREATGAGEIDLTGQAAGLYFLTVQTDNAKTALHVKVLLQQ